MPGPHEVQQIRCPLCLTPRTLVYNHWYGDKLNVFAEHHHSGKIVRIKIPYFDWVELTADHQVLTVPVKHHELPLTEQARFKSAKDLTPTYSRKAHEAVVIPKIKRGATQISIEAFIKPASQRNFLPPTFPLTMDFAELLGWYVAEGFPVEGKSIFFTLGKHETVNINRVLKLIENLGYRGSHKETRTAVVICLPSRVLSRALPIWCGKGALNKKVPDFMFHSSREISERFLTAYRLGDGYSRLRTQRLYASLKTISPLLARGIQFLYFQLGHNFCLTHCPTNGREIIEGRIVSAHDRYVLQGYTDIYRLYKNWEDDDCWYLPISRIESVDYDGIVFDATSKSGQLQVPFLINNCGMHSPLEQVDYGPYLLQLWLKQLGGKRALTDEERESGEYRTGRGRAPGILTYNEMELTEEIKEMVRDRIAKALDLIS